MGLGVFEEVAVVFDLADVRAGLLQRGFVDPRRLRGVMFKDAF